MHSRPELFHKQETHRGKLPFASVKLAWPSLASAHLLGVLGGSAGNPSRHLSRLTRDMPLPLFGKHCRYSQLDEQVSSSTWCQAR